METLAANFMMLFFLAAMLGLLFLGLCFVAGPNRAPEYIEIRHPGGEVHYFVNGMITPLKPEPRPFLQRLMDMDGLNGGWKDGGMGADG